MSVLAIEQLKSPHIGPINLTLNAGECVCISGPSGSGKTLLLRAIADLDPHQGSISLGGQSYQELAAPEWRQRVGLLLSESFWWYDSIGEHFKHADTSLLEQIGFDRDVMTWQVRRCSTGERQRLALVRLLSQQPKVLLLDEPTANLDQDNTQCVEDIITQYQAKHNASVLWVSHDPQQTQRLCIRQFAMKAGKLEPVTA